MPDISKIKLPSGNEYDIKDATARSMIAGGITFNIVWTATDYASSSAPSAQKLSSIPKDYVVYYNDGESSATGTLVASEETKGIFYLIYSKTQSGNLDTFEEVVTVENGSSFIWEKIGDTQIDLSNVVTDVSLTKVTDVALGENTTFTNASSSVSFGVLTGHTDTVLGTSSTFTVTDPTITVTPSTTYIKATASGTAVGADGTASAVTGYANPSTDTFVKSVSAETDKNLVTTTVPNVTSAGSASTWSFAMGSGSASETLIISGANSTAPTLGTAKTVATGETSTTGEGDAVVTGVTIGSSASAITALGTPTTSTVLTGVKVNTQPTIAIATDSSSGTGKVQVATGISSATASGGAVSASGDNVTAVVSMPTATAAAQTITVGTNDEITVLTNATDVAVTKGNE